MIYLFPGVAHQNCKMQPDYMGVERLLGFILPLYLYILDALARRSFPVFAFCYCWARVPVAGFALSGKPGG